MSEPGIILKNVNRIKLLLVVIGLFLLGFSSTSASSPNDECFACHATENRSVNQSLYNSNPHNILECIDCHVNSTTPQPGDPGHGQFIRQFNGSNLTGPILTKYYSEYFSLCYFCHAEEKVVGITSEYVSGLSPDHMNDPIIVSSMGTNFINTNPNGQPDAGSFPANIHWDHLDDFGSILHNGSAYFDSNHDGIKDSYYSCVACHNVHGTNYPKMTRDSMAISYSNDTNGDYGFIKSRDYKNTSNKDYICNGACHSNGTTFTNYYRTEIKLFQGCVSCHSTNMTKDFNVTAFARGVHVDINTSNGSGSVNNSDCWTCHYNRNMNKSNKYTCVECHVQIPGIVPDAPKVISHKPEKTNKTSCEACHDLVKLNPGLNDDDQEYPNITSHYAQLPLVPTENYCDYCHGPDASSLFQAPYRNITSFYHNSSNDSFSGNSTCRTCHTRTDVTADPLAKNDSNFHNLTTEYGDVKINDTGVVANCVDCHVDHNTTFVNAPSPSHNITGMNLTHCYLCHGNKVTGTNVQKLHDVRSNITTDCISCHQQNEVNVSVFGSHMNINLTGGQDNITDDDCKTCHFGSQTGELDMVPGGANRNNTYYCEDCHENNSLPGAPDVISHRPGKTNKTSCEDCHDLVKLDPGLNDRGQNYSKITSHYLQKPIILTQNYCDYCHGPDASSPFQASNRSIPSFYHNSSNASFPENANCRTCHTRTDVTADPLANNDSNFHNLTTEYGDVKNSTGVVADCIYCHVDHDPQFASAPQPSHSTSGLGINKCYLCHGTKVTGTNAQKLHDVPADVTTGCVQCHAELDEINITLFGRHINLNITDGGQENLTDDDCKTCHFGGKTGDLLMIPGGANSSNTYDCVDCHVDGDVPAPGIKNHRPNGTNIETTANCTTCHNNSINLYAFSLNASVSHYLTNVSLVKTVNQTLKPRFGFMTSGDALAYNKDCNNCHNPSNSSYGNATLITTGHIGKATCNGCHVDGSAPDLHNESLGFPVTFNCRSCHTTYADKYGAANLSGTNMADYSTCGGNNCHLGISSTGSLDTLAKHNVDRTFSGTAGSTDTVYLNNNVSLTVTKGVPVEVTARIKDAPGAASRVGGAEYYIDVDPGQGKGIPMDPSDGYYNAVKGNWENINATLDTGNLSDGNHTVFVRGMDIGKQWSAPMNAQLVIQPLGYINGTVTSNSVALAGAIITTTDANTITLENGNFSLRVPAGTYNVTASKQPTHYDNTSTDVMVASGNTTIILLDLAKKPTGNISGMVTNE
ncbi:MAG: hypothetical protein FIB07_12485 [Candidatus Methanoperedens sp.]|nr:hypothetical protein [Candidatus Methanoperedens sp.]